MAELHDIELYIYNPKSIIAQFISLGSGEVDETAKRVRKEVLAAFDSRFPTHKSLDEVPHLTLSNIEEHKGKLVRFTAMIQHDSLGEQFFIPLGLNRNGVLQNLGLFGSQDEGDNELVELGRLMGRRMMVVTSPPKHNVDNSEERLLVFLYDDGFETKVNDLVNIVGIFEHNVNEEGEYPQNLLTIHALKVLPYKYELSHFSDLEGAKAQVIQLFSRLGFDDISTKKVILALLSKVSHRTPGLLTSLLVGHYPLNIRVPVEEITDNLLNVLVAIHPHSRVIRLSPPELEEQEFSSRMDYDSGRLEQGLLQVPDGTLIVIDERCLQPGKLSETAAKNLQAIIDLISHQTVQYDFGGQSISIPTNVPIISISHGKSILSIDEFVALGHPSESVDAEAIPQYIMDYFQHCRALNVEIQGDAAEQIEQHYLQERQSAQKLDANHLSRVLNIARLMAACDGCNNYLNMDHYLAALELTKSS